MQLMMQGARLAYVVRKIDGEVEREKAVYDKEKGLTKVTRKEPGGFMVYFPRGHALRLSEAQIKQYRLDKEPHIINMEGLYDPNSPLGKLLMADDDGNRMKAFRQLEEQCIRMACVKTGSMLMPEQHAELHTPRARQQAKGA